jgi:uncharacterized membrane protein
MRMRTVVGGTVAALAVTVGTSLGAGALTGEFTEVEAPLPGGFISGSDINDAGQSTGQAEFAGGMHAYLRDADGTYTDLAPLAGETFSQGTALNESGDVVGGSGGLAVLWEAGGAPQDLGLLPGDTDSIAWDINDDGWIVGVSSGGGVYHSWARDPGTGTLIDMGTIGGATVVQVAAISDAGVAVGRALVGGEWAGFTWNADDGISELGLPPGEVSFEPDDINASGQVVGHVFEFVAPEGFYRAYVRDPDGTWTELTSDGYTTAFGHAINDAGLVVGFVDNEGSPSRTPAAWDLSSGDHTVYPLFVDAGFTSELMAVNDNGVALGVSREGDDFDRTFIGPIGPDPVPPTEPPAAVPVAGAPSFTG